MGDRAQAAAESEDRDQCNRDDADEVAGKHLCKPPHQAETDDRGTLDDTSEHVNGLANGEPPKARRDRQLRKHRQRFAHWYQQAKRPGRRADGVEQPREHELGICQAAANSRQAQRHDVHAVVVRLRAARRFGQVAAHLRQFVIVDEQCVEAGEAGHLFHGLVLNGKFHDTLLAMAIKPLSRSLLVLSNPGALWRHLPTHTSGSPLS